MNITQIELLKYRVYPTTMSILNSELIADDVAVGPDYLLKLTCFHTRNSYCNRYVIGPT